MLADFSAIRLRGMGEGAPAAADFPWLQYEVLPYPGAFRDNIQAFLRDHAAPAPGVEVPRVAAWTAVLGCRDTSVRLHIYEEQLNEQKPVFCDPCRIIGEQHTPASPALERPPAGGALPSGV